MSGPVKPVGHEGAELGVRMLVRVSPTAAALLLGAVACSEPLTDLECVRMLEHYTELLIQSDRPNTKAAEREKLKAEVRAKASRDPEFLSCKERVSRRQFDCALGAADLDTAERCLL